MDEIAMATRSAGTSTSSHRQVFISYSGEDRVIAEKVCRLLERDDLPCWIAPRDVVPGHDFAEQIIDAIESTRVMVLVLSSHANSSIFVRNEVERAISKGKVVVPLRIQDVQPSRALELFVSRSQWIDAWTPPLAARVHLLAVGLHGLLGLPNIQDEDPTTPTPPHGRSLWGGTGRAARRFGVRSLAPLALVGLAVVLAAGALFLGGRLLGSTGDGASPTGSVNAASQPAVSAPSTAEPPTVNGLVFPTNVMAIGTSSSSISITWTDNSTAETGYRIRRWDGTAWAIIYELPANATTYVDTGLVSAGFYYTYQVCAYNSGGEQCNVGATGYTSS